jgi:hypothetical protein
MKIQNSHSILAAGTGALLLGLWFFAFQIELDKGRPSLGSLLEFVAVFGSLLLCSPSFGHTAPWALMRDSFSERRCRMIR